MGTFWYCCIVGVTDSDSRDKNIGVAAADTDQTVSRETVQEANPDTCMTDPDHPGKGKIRSWKTMSYTGDDTSEEPDGWTTVVRRKKKKKSRK